MAEQNVEAVILAAGLGTRMKSDTIKILHRAGGRAIVDYVITLAESITGTAPILVIGHQRDAVRAHCGERARYAVQDEQLGTGHAVLQARSALGDSLEGKTVLILSGDVPLTRRETLDRMIVEHHAHARAATLLSMVLDVPALYGRIVRGSDGELQRIVEAKDASSEELLLSEVNGGIYLFDAPALFDTLSTLSTDNSQGEYYLTDVIARLREKGRSVGAVIADDPVETLGVNSRAELATVESELVRRRVDELMAQGVTFRNPAAISIDSSVSIGADTVVYPFVTLEGETSIGRNCIVEPGVHLRNVIVEDNVTLRTGTVAEDARIASHSAVGPYSHLRPGTVLQQSVKIGNFVETKKAVFARGAKASHLSYIGDAEVGAEANIGAGTITCNYDGVNKHKTTIGEGAFIGSDTQLVAPVTIGKGAYVGAGSTVTKDVPPDSLALSRTPQKTIVGWATKRREEMKKEK